MTDDVGESFPLDIPGSWTHSDADVAAIVVNLTDISDQCSQWNGFAELT